MYGTAKKSSYAGSASMVTSKDLAYLAYLAYLALSSNLRRLFAEPPSAFRRTSDGPSPKCDTGFNGCLCKSGCAYF